MDNLELAQEKLSALQKALILEVDAATKFKLQHEIDELKKLIEELKQLISTLKKPAKRKATSPIKKEEEINPEQLIDWLLENMKKILPAQLKEIAFSYHVPEEYLPPNLPQVEKAIEILKFGKEKEGDQFPKLRQLVEKATHRNFIN